MQNRTEFERELRETQYLHHLLPLHKERSLEVNYPNKKVDVTRVLWDGKENVSAVDGGLRGKTFCTESDGEQVIRVEAPLRRSEWPEGTPPYGDYCNFGEAVVKIPLKNENLSEFNRLHFWVKPQVRGARIVHLNVSMKNEGEIKVPDKYFREGATVFDLVNNKWNECFWEFPSLPRDMISEIRFFVFLSGQDTPTGPKVIYDYKDIRLEKIEKPEKEKGWSPADGRILFSSEGYLPDGKKTAIVQGDAKNFTVSDAKTNKTVFEGATKHVSNDLGQFEVLDFSELTVEGEYFLSVGNLKSEIFLIDKNLMNQPVWKAINFFYAERCGTHVPGKHGVCHTDVYAEHEGVKMPFCGGWHDAGDLSQQAAQTAEITHALLEAMSVTDDEMLETRLSEEAQWGLDFILRTRLGGGYRATSAGMTRWTNNKIGDMDDVPVRVHDHSYENFLFSGVEAYAATVLAKTEPDLSDGALSAAIEDYEFAVKKFDKTGVEPAQMFEHTYNSGLSQYFAVACWTSSLLYRATNEDKYAVDARKWGAKLLECQESGDAGIGMKGFFYRDASHKAIVHFNHQSREYQFVQALATLYETQSSHEDAKKWLTGISLYGEYLKALEPYTYPYGMLAAGVHRNDEPEDAKTFEVLHVASKYEEEVDNYRKQLAAGVPIDDEHVIRKFPIWFSFRGNSAVHLAMGKAAAIAGKLQDDKQLLQLGREQLYWVFGKNPFGQSLMYGVGSNYCDQYTVMLGDTVGAVPVGIETYENEDQPYWPGNNNATYREVWVGAVTRWLWLANEFLI